MTTAWEQNVRNEEVERPLVQFLTGFSQHFDQKRSDLIIVFSEQHALH
jgi:hypothetical protein